MNENKTIIDTFLTLLKVKDLDNMLASKISEILFQFRKDIEAHFLAKCNVIPFPSGWSRLYEFKIYRSPERMVDRWEASILGKHGDLAWDSVLPFKLIKEICSYPVNPDEINLIQDIKYKGNRCNIRFIKYLENGIVGNIEKIDEETGDGVHRIDVFDVEHYLKLDEEKKKEIFYHCFDSYPMARKAILFNFFTQIMPEYMPLRELT